MLLPVWQPLPPKLALSLGRLLGRLQQRLLPPRWQHCWGQQACLRRAQDVPATTGQLQMQQPSWQLSAALLLVVLPAQAPAQLLQQRLLQRQWQQQQRVLRHSQLFTRPCIAAVT
jgi:hypothetical protein